MASNYYDVLDIPRDADCKAISDAYKKMALKWHPDKNPDNIDEANQRFKQISEAYQVLSDSTKRSRYDRSQNSDDDDDPDHFYDSDDDECGSFFDFVSAEMLFRHFFRQFEAKGFTVFSAHEHDQHGQPNRRDCRNKNAEAVRRLAEKRRENATGEESCHIRTVNGKQWMTKTYYEDGIKIVARYEDGELISKQINGVPQKI